MSIKLITRQVGDVSVIDVSGVVNAGSGGDVTLREAIRELVQDGAKKILLNFADVSYIDSSGLGMLLSLVTRGICPKCYTKFDSLSIAVGPYKWWYSRFPMTDTNTFLFMTPAKSTELINDLCPKCREELDMGNMTIVKDKPTWGELKLVNVSRKIQDLLVITRQITMFEIYEDEAAAIQSFR